MAVGAVGSARRDQEADRLAHAREIRDSVLRVECLKCVRLVAIEREEALRRFDGNSLWKLVAVRLLGDGCAHRTGRHEEDGCWPDFR